MKEKFNPEKEVRSVGWLLLLLFVLIELLMDHTVRFLSGKTNSSPTQG
jgi:hypothetical protein